MAEQLLKTGMVNEEMLKQINVENVRKEIGCKLLMNSGMQRFQTNVCSYIAICIYSYVHKIII